MIDKGCIIELKNYLNSRNQLLSKNHTNYKSGIYNEFIASLRKLNGDSTYPIKTKQ